MKNVDCDYCDDQEYGNNGDACPHCNYEKVERSRAINWEPEEEKEYDNMDGR